MTCDYYVYVEIWVCLKFCYAVKVCDNNCIFVCSFDNLKCVYTRGFNTGKSHIYNDLYMGFIPKRHIYTWQWFVESTYTSQGFVEKDVWSVNEVLPDNLSLTLMFEVELIDWRSDDVASYMWLKTCDGYVIVLEWLSVSGFNSVRVSE